MDTEYLKKVGLNILTAILSLCAIFYFGYHFWRSSTKEVETQPVGDISIEETASCDAYIFREETVLKKTTSGKSIVPLVNEGEKVCPEFQVAKIFSDASSKKLADMAEIDERIELLEKCTKDGTVSLKASSKLDAEINEILSNIREASSKGDGAGAVALKSKFIMLLNKRNLLISPQTNFEKEVSNLENEKQALMGELGTCLETVESSESGYYYTETDGYEEIFNCSELEKAGYDDLCDIFSKAPSDISSNAGKIVTSSTWYMALLLDKKYEASYKEGSTCTVKTTGGVDLSMDVSRVVKGDNQIILILKTKDMPDKFEYRRMQKVEIITKVYSGYKVPSEAIRIVNGKTGVYILDEMTVRFRRVSEIYRTDSYCIVKTKAENEAAGNSKSKKTITAKASNNRKDNTEWLDFHDAVIIKGKGLYDGRVVGK